MQYKVVKWPHDLDDDRTRRLSSGLMFEVLHIDIVKDGRLKLSPWRRLQIPCPYLLQLSSQVHVNGIIYWTTSDVKILSFSLQDETFCLSPKPPCFCLDTQGSKESHFFTLSGSRGNLWILYYTLQFDFMEIWKMEESEGGRLDKIHKINLGGVYPNNIDGKVHVIDILPDKVFFRLSPLRSRLSLLYFDAKTNILLNYDIGSGDYQICDSTDGLLSLQNMDMSNFEPCSSFSSSFLLDG